MRSIIETYSVEKIIDGKPTGEFYLNRGGFDAIAREIVATHVKPDNVEKYLNDTSGSQDNRSAGVQPHVSRIDMAWQRGDVNATGLIEASRAPTYLREIVGRGYDFGLQMQKTAKPT